MSCLRYVGLQGTLLIAAQANESPIRMRASMATAQVRGVLLWQLNVPAQSCHTSLSLTALWPELVMWSHDNTKEPKGVDFRISVNTLGPD